MDRETDGMVEEHAFFLTGAIADHLRRRRAVSICGRFTDGSRREP